MGYITRELIIENIVSFYSRYEHERSRATVRFLGEIQEQADEYNDRLAVALDRAEINGYI